MCRWGKAHSKRVHQEIRIEMRHHRRSVKQLLRQGREDGIPAYLSIPRTG